MVRRFIGEGVTDSNGLTSVDYGATGKGKILFVASSGDLEASIPFYDVLYKDIGTASDHSTNWVSTSTTTEWGSEYATVTRNDPSVFSPRYITIPSTVKHIELDIRVETDGTIDTIMSLRNNTSSVSALTNQFLKLQIDTWHHIEIDIDDLKYYVKVDGVICTDIRSGVTYDYKVLTNTFNRFYFAKNADSTNWLFKYKNFIYW